MKKTETNICPHFTEIETDKIIEKLKFQARKIIDQKATNRMLKKNNSRQNVIVAKIKDDNEHFILISGEDVLSETIDSGRTTVPAIVYAAEADTRKLLSISLEEEAKAGMNSFEYYIVFEELFKEKFVRYQNEIPLLFNNAISLIFVKKIMSYKWVHPRIIEDAKSGKLLNVDIICAIKRKVNNLKKEKLSLTKEAIYQKYIFPVYELIQKNNISVKEAVKMIGRINIDEAKKIPAVEITDKKITIHREYIDIDKIIQLEKFIKKLEI